MASVSSPEGASEGQVAEKPNEFLTICAPILWYNIGERLRGDNEIKTVVEFSVAAEGIHIFKHLSRNNMDEY